MIANATLQGGGGTEKEYKITLEANISVEAFPSKAKAGNFILANVVSMRAITQSGRTIPYDYAKWEGCTFIMPAEGYCNKRSHVTTRKAVVA